MLELNPIASGSAGNAYILTDGFSSLLLECGINIKEIQKAFHFKLTDAAGCLVTHSHKDHCKAVKEVAGAGIDIYMSQGTKEEIGIHHHRIHGIQAGKVFKLGSWKIKPFSVEHDVSDPVGYLIENSQGERMIFVTDTYFVRYKFKGLKMIAVECNYSEQIVNENIRAGIVPFVMKRRLMESHFSLENVKEFLRASDLSDTDEIWLLHLSNNNSDEQLFKSEIQKLTGIPVNIA